MTNAWSLEAVRLYRRVGTQGRCFIPQRKSRGLDTVRRQRGAG